MSKKATWRIVFSAALLILSGCSPEEATMKPIGGAGTGVAGTFATAGTSAAGTGTSTAGTGTLPRAGTGTTTGGAGTRGGASGTGVSAAGTGAAGTGTAGTGTAGTGAAGTGSPTAGTGAAGAAGTMATAGTGAPPTPGEGPTLPAIAGTCPEFRNGSTIMVAGHRGVAISAGAPGKGGPLLFYWHGTGQSPAEAMRTLPAAVRSEIIDSGGIIAAFDGRQQSSGAGGDCSGTSAHAIADFAAADQIAACAVKNHGVDARKIYSTGCSAGGLQTGCMAILRSSYLAAAAPNSGGIIGRRTWQDMHSPAIFTMHGGSSDVVGVRFSDTSASLDMTAKMHGSFVVNCNHGGGHCMAPAALQSAAWKFMKDHPWGVKPSPWMAAIPAGVPDSCKIF